jgi:hypothetical protein
LGGAAMTAVGDSLYLFLQSEVGRSSELWAIYPGEAYQEWFVGFNFTDVSQLNSPTAVIDGTVYLFDRAIVTALYTSPIEAIEYPDPFISRRNQVVGVANGKIYVFGGENLFTRDPETQVEVFIPN